MATSKRKTKSAEIKQLEKLIASYEAVFVDFEQDIGWPKRLHRKVLSSLAQRKWELENIWWDELEQAAEKDA